MVHSYELQCPTGYAAPRLLQRNAWANIDDRTVYWFSIWREEGSTWAPNNPRGQTGVWVATWERDRLGHFAPCLPNHGFDPGRYEPHCISCPIELDRQGRRVFINADRLGQYSQLKVELLDLQFRPIPGYSGDDCIAIGESGLRRPVAWRDKEKLAKFDHPIRVRVNWEGIRPEDTRLHAVYVS